MRSDFTASAAARARRSGGRRRWATAALVATVVLAVVQLADGSPVVNNSFNYITSGLTDYPLS